MTYYWEHIRLMHTFCSSVAQCLRLWRTRVVPCTTHKRRPWTLLPTGQWPPALNGRAVMFAVSCLGQTLRTLTRKKKDGCEIWQMARFWVRGQQIPSYVMETAQDMPANFIHRELFDHFPKRNSTVWHQQSGWSTVLYSDTSCQSGGTAWLKFEE